MLIASDHLGELDVDDSLLIEVVGGVIGFPDATRFALVEAEETGIYCWLQSVDHPGLSFLSLVPWPFFPDYEPELPDEDCETLGLARPEDAQVLCLVTIGDEAVTANLLGPVVVNTATRRARQVVLVHSDLPTNAPVLPPA